MENVKSAKNYPIDITFDFLEILILSYKLMTTNQEVESYELQQNTPFSIAARMNALYNNIINSKDAKLNDVIALAEAYYHISAPYIKRVEVEKLFIADFYLTRCMKLLKGRELNRKAIWIAVRALNELSKIWYKLKNSKQAKLFIKKSLELYLTYTDKLTNYLSPINILSLVDNKYDENYIHVLNKLHMETLNLILIYTDHFTDIFTKIPQLKEDENIVMYVHKLLKEQLKQVQGVARVEWALESAKLSRCFRMCGRFTEAKSHLDTACAMMKKFYEEECANEEKLKETAKSTTEAYERYIDAYSCIVISYARYGIALLHASLDHMQRNEKESKLCETNILDLLSDKTTKDKQSMELLLFADMKDTKQIDITITDKYVTNFTEAKKIFVDILKCLNDAKLNNNKTSKCVVTSTEITRDISKAYKHLANFEKDKEKRMKLHKLRIDILQDISKTQILPETILKQILFDKAIIYDTLLNLKTDSASIIQETLGIGIGPESESPKEITELIQNNLQNFRLSLSLK